MSLKTIFSAALLSVCAAAVPLPGHECDHNRHHHYAGCAGCDQTSAQPQRSFLKVEGRISEVIYLAGSTPDTGMVELRVQTASAAKLVRLAPAGFLRGAGLQLKEGDTVAVNGIAVSGMEGDLIVATEVLAGGKTVNLRDRRGRPAW